MKKIISLLVTILFLALTACSAPTDHRTANDKVEAPKVQQTAKSEKTTTPLPAQNLSNGTKTPESNQNKQITDSAKTLKIHFIDVGQADSSLIVFPNGKALLIDAGNNVDGQNIVNYIKKQGIARLEAVVGSHPHADHLGGIDTVINNLDIGSVYMPKVTSNTKTFEDVLKAIKAKNLKVTTAAAGVKLDIDPDVRTEMLAPNNSKYDDLNNYSAIIKLTYGQTSFLMEADAQEVSEKEMLAKGYDLKSSAIRLGHHGSHSSSSPAFISAVSPSFGIISCGTGNDYGHPHKETLSTLAKANVKVYRTDLNGTIVSISDGTNITFRTSK